MSSQYIGETIGTFIFVYIALTNPTDPVAIAVGLFIGILIAITFKSNAYLNPATALANYANGNIKGDETCAYIGAELAGVLLSLGLFYLYTNQNKF
jgi:glycerol uptake facilitator-like aquaporin